MGSSHISVFSLFRLPLGAFQPSDLLYVYEERGRLAGLARTERDGLRDEWTIVELDAVDNGEAGDIRYRLVQHLLRDATKRGALRFHVACADVSGNVELFMQAGFARYGEERILYRPADKPRLPQIAPADAAARGIRPAAPSTRSNSTGSTAPRLPLRLRVSRTTGCTTGSGREGTGVFRVRR